MPHYYLIDMQPIHFNTLTTMICKVTFTFYLLQKRNQRWKALEKRSDEIVKYTDTKNEMEEKMPHFQEKQG